MGALLWGRGVELLDFLGGLSTGRTLVLVHGHVDIVPHVEICGRGEIGKHIWFKPRRASLSVQVRPPVPHNHFPLDSLRALWYYLIRSTRMPVGLHPNNEDLTNSCRDELTFWTDHANPATY